MIEHPTTQELIIILLSIALVAISLVAFKQRPKCPTPKCPPAKVNLTCPKDNYVCNPQVEPNITLPYNNIQSTHFNLNYTLKNNTLSVDDIDAYGELYGSSMRPTLFTGNQILEKLYHGQELQEGDIIRYNNGEGYTIHRIEGNYMDGGGYYVTQGDSNRYIDNQKVYKSNITHVIVGVLYT